ncbi:protein-L-isoaspartate(D-aspartate) O-methyltransferase [Methyloligella solikamskensis]|uniref:Protein-L-isoaspartate O-methyltransferase n=1 Tax=Methyloligella solikamskensis TaxID=1177756 RepID=A0ABW3JCK9_9HYPH
MAPPQTNPRHAEHRAFMVERHLRARGIRDPLVIAAMGEVPREAFVSGELEEFAYEDSALPIEAGQTISQPYIVARMAELATLEPTDKVLEVGAGSGFAAAVFGRIAAQVYAIERHEELANLARSRIARLGYDNVEIICGDGTKGFAEEEPFDAIIVSAGGPRVPEALKRQLAPGGRLVLPVGTGRMQELIRVTRNEDDTFEEESFGGVAFVPLIGEEGWPDQNADDATEMDSQPGPLAAPIQARRTLEKRGPSQLMSEAAEPFAELDELARMVDRFADRRIVMLGEATHGTSEFYQARAAITERLVRQHGFNIVAVEADWPDAAVYNAVIQGLPRPRLPERPFSRFPTWMWRNAEVEALLKRLAAVNAEIRGPERRCGFYGLDIYSLATSIGAVLDYLDRVDPEAGRIARERYSCLAPWRAEPARYGRMAISRGYEACERAVGQALQDLLAKRLDYLHDDGEAFFSAAQNAHIVAGAEEYYRTIYYGGALSWNLRDQHMFDTLERLLEHRGPGSKAVVWAHNSHIGDARATEMGQVRGEHNIGQLARQRFGDQVGLIGFGTDRGTVAAASDWDAPMEVKRVRAARDDSFEGVSRATDIAAFLLETGPGQREEIRTALAEPLLERAIGVIYRPESERLSHYFEAELSNQFDAWIWFAETQAVTARPHAEHGPEETYPFGL